MSVAIVEKEGEKNHMGVNRSHRGARGIDRETGTDCIDQHRPKFLNLHRYLCTKGLL